MAIEQCLRKGRALNTLSLIVGEVHDLHVYRITIYNVKRKSARKVIDYRQA